LPRTGDNELVYVPRAFSHQAQFEAAVARVARKLGPDFLSVTPTLGYDWYEEPAVFFLVVLSDAASRRDQLLQSTERVLKAIVRQVKPLEEWGVLPYFDYRSQSEQARVDQRALAS
jgi:hypothetical protein